MKRNLPRPGHTPRKTPENPPKRAFVREYEFFVPKSLQIAPHIGYPREIRPLRRNFYWIS